MYELLYTSARKGLFPGSQGFCTVAATRGLPAALAERLEALSGYRHLFPPSDAGRDPVAHSHLHLHLAGRRLHALSRVAAFGLDYTGRSNKLAHHAVLEAGECPPGGPAWLLARPQFLRGDWDGAVGHLPAREVPRGEDPARACSAWQALTGDAGWAGALAETGAHGPGRVVYLVFEPGTDLLPLIAEALRLLPPARRWEVPFSTYFTGLPPDVPCLWRGVPAGSREAREAARVPGAVIWELGRGMGRAPESPFTAAARSGEAPPLPAAGAEGFAPSGIPAPRRPRRGEEPQAVPLAARDPVAPVSDAPAAPSPGRRKRHKRPAGVAAESGGGSLLTMLLGLGLGMLLLGAAVVAVEVIAGRPLAGMMGLAADQREQELLSRIGWLEGELDTHKLRADAAQRERDLALAKTRELAGRQQEPRNQENRPLPGSEGDAGRKAAEKELEQTRKKLRETEAKLAKTEEELALLRAQSPSQKLPPLRELTNVAKVIDLIPKPGAGAGDDRQSGKIPLAELGLRAADIAELKLENLPGSVGSSNTPLPVVQIGGGGKGLQVNFGGDLARVELARFEIVGEELVFKWGAGGENQDRPLGREKVRHAILRTMDKNGRICSFIFQPPGVAQRMRVDWGHPDWTVEKNDVQHWKRSVLEGKAEIRKFRPLDRTINAWGGKPYIRRIEFELYQKNNPSPVHLRFEDRGGQLTLVPPPPDTLPKGWSRPAARFDPERKEVRFSITLDGPPRAIKKDKGANEPGAGSPEKAVSAAPAPGTQTDFNRDELPPLDIPGCFVSRMELFIEKELPKKEVLWVPVFTLPE